MRMACGRGIYEVRECDLFLWRGRLVLLPWCTPLTLSLPFSHLGPPFFPTGHSGGGRVFLVVLCGCDRVLVVCGGGRVLVASW
jgi:hypothetical protein